jgi:hypothetical protein
MAMTEAILVKVKGVAIAVGAGLGFDQSVHVLAQTVPSLNDAFVMQLAEKGGGWVVLMIVLFFYRRDYQRLTISESEVRRELMAAYSRQAESEHALAMALQENTNMTRNFLSQVGLEERRMDERRADDDRRREDERRAEERRRP